MASTSVDSKAPWREGDICLAPNPRDGTLREARIQRLIPASTYNVSTASVVFTIHGDDADEETKEETPIPVDKLQMPGFSDFSREKPLFPGSVGHPGTCMPMVLCRSNADIDNMDKVPYTINRYLRDYQREGIRFIYDNYTQSRGCILGDDMGLGKTVQVIGFLGAVLHKTGTWEDIENNRPHFLLTQVPCGQTKPQKVFLIVAPLSVLYNWKDELDTWGHFQCVVVHGLRKEEELARIKKGRSEIALTTYETLRLCLNQFNNIDWSAVIVDEAHKIKNPNSQITQAMKELKCQVRIGLTGTILQNNLEELWCVMDWAIPGCLGSLGNFKNKFSDPIEQGQRHNATKRALATGRKCVRTLARKISHWFLRRTKALIKGQLPKKNDRVVYCSLTDFQQTVYQTVLDSEDVKLLLRSSEKCDCQSGQTRRSCCYKTNSEGVKIKELYFSYLAILRKVANHVALLQPSPGTSKKQRKYLSTICERVFQKFPEFVKRCKDEAFEAMSDPIYSGKMKVLEKLLKYYMQKKDKVLLFSLSTKLLDVLESYCMAEGLDYSRLDGTTKSKDRVKIVKEFNSCPHTNICLVSTMAGGLGLNFVGANVVVLFDPTWNPANDLQAIDRAYRIGQCRDVTVLRLISLGTVEEVIYLRQVYKQQLQSSVVGRESARRYFEAVQGADSQKGELFGIKNLFRLQTQGTCLTRKILEREGQVEAGVTTTSTSTGQEEEEEEQERERVCELGDSPSLNGPKLNMEMAGENRNASVIPERVLDFSSGSEDDGDEEGKGARRKASDCFEVDGTRGGNNSTTTSRLNLLQHGFSGVLQRVGAKTGSGTEDSGLSEGESGECSKPEKSGKMEGTFSGVSKNFTTPGNEETQGPKSWMNNRDLSTDPERKDSRNGGEGEQKTVSHLEKSVCTGREKPGLKEGVMRKKRAEAKDSNENVGMLSKAKTTVPKVHLFESYSDESEDLDIEAKTWPRIDALNPQVREVDRGRPASLRKRQTALTRDRVRSRHIENIETFTSSDEEHMPVKRVSSKGGHMLTPQTERFQDGGAVHKVRGPKDGQKVFEKTDRAGRERQPEIARAISFTGQKTQTSSASMGLDGTIDYVLGGVQGVAYTHSNQRVVGGSKAEERISRAAVRDVFEHKMYSQFPANQILDTQESLSESPPESPLHPANVRVELAATSRTESHSVDHPVTFTNRTVHPTAHTIFMIGQTPQAICRQQLEEMAAQFKFSSVHQFAGEVLKSSSTQRQVWLRQFYSALNLPALTDMVTHNFPQPDSAQPGPKKTTHPSSPVTTTPSSSSRPKARARTKRTSRKAGFESPSNSRTPKTSAPQPRKEPRDPHRNAPEPLRDVSVSELEEREETVCDARGHKRTTRYYVSCSEASRVEAGLGSDQTGSKTLGPGQAAAFLDHRDRDTSSSLPFSHGLYKKPSKPTTEAMEKELKSYRNTCKNIEEQIDDLRHPPPPEEASSNGSRHSLLTDLIGDTSILDDLFRPKPKVVHQSGSTKAPSTSTLLSANSRLGNPSSSSPFAYTESMAPTHSQSSRISHTPTTRSVTQASPRRSKCSRKDFWDILNEGNEESINRLTDISEVEKVCISSSLTARARARGEARESAVLWKTNEKFLWKK